MGVLDDAIREHLELKRKHGVPEEELRRQEAEALGPARREVSSPTDEEAPGDGEEPLEAAESAEEAARPGEAPAADATGPISVPFDGDALPPDIAPEAAEPEPFPEEEAPVIRRASEPDEPLPDPEAPDEPVESSHDRLDPDVEPTPDYPPKPEDHAIGRDPIDDGAHGAAPAEEYDEGEEDEAEAERSGDLLEDTPDFLEETPEHDRLWFEQKPPRDFDFD
jgi:hypothetical protein